MTGRTLQQRIEKREKEIANCEGMVRHYNLHIKNLRTLIANLKKENHPERDRHIAYAEGLIKWNQEGITQFTEESAVLKKEIDELKGRLS